MKKVIGTIKLRANTPAWCDRKNNIHLTKSHPSREVYEGTDMKPILEGVKSKLITFEEAKEEKPKMSPTQKAAAARKKAAKKEPVAAPESKDAEASGVDVKVEVTNEKPE